MSACGNWVENWKSLQPPRERPSQQVFQPSIIRLWQVPPKPQGRIARIPGGWVNPRILIADEHEIVLEGIRTLLARARREWEICGEARNGEEAVELVRRLRPDVIVLDITMPRVSGLQAATQIAKLNLGGRIL